MGREKLISVILVNFNGLIDTCTFIESWINIIHSFDYEIIVVDNGSNEDESVLLKQLYPDIVSLRSEANLGFAGANNLGYSVSKGDWIFFLNNDTIIIEDTLPAFVHQLAENGKMAGISPLILNNDLQHTVQFAGYTHLNRLTLRNKAILEGDMPQLMQHAIKTEFLHGAAMLFKREAIERVGTMSEDYFLYYEEFDWCEHFRKKGYELWVSPSLKIIHCNSKTIGAESPLKTYYLTRNRLLFAYNNYYKALFVFTFCYHLLCAYPYHIVRALVGRKYDTAKSICKGLSDFCKYIF